MAWVLRNNWPWTLLAFLVGAIITWILLNRRPQPPAEVPAEQEETVEEKTLVGAGVTAAGTPSAAAAAAAAAEPTPTPTRTPKPSSEPKPESRSKPKPKSKPEAKPDSEPEPKPEPKPDPEPDRNPAPEPAALQPAFSQRMDAGEPTLFDDVEPATNEVQVKAEEVPAGRYGEGSADAVAHQGPPDGFTIKGNTQSMLFHTPDSPYYGRTKPEVWFRTESDAERAGFTKYARKPRKSTRPVD